VTTYEETGTAQAGARQLTIGLVEEAGRWTIAEAHLQAEDSGR